MMKSILSVACLSMLFVGCAGSRNNQGQKNQDLIQASREGKIPQVVALIRQGADVNATDPEGWTPYLAASAEGNWQVMKVLQGAGAKTDPGF